MLLIVPITLGGDEFEQRQRMTTIRCDEPYALPPVSRGVAGVVYSEGERGAKDLYNTRANRMSHSGIGSHPRHVHVGSQFLGLGSRDHGMPGAGMACPSLRELLSCAEHLPFSKPPLETAIVDIVAIREERRKRLSRQGIACALKAEGCRRW